MSPPAEKPLLPDQLRHFLPKVRDGFASLHLLGLQELHLKKTGLPNLGCEICSPSSLTFGGLIRKTHWQKVKVLTSLGKMQS